MNDGTFAQSQKPKCNIEEERLLQDMLRYIDKVPSARARDLYQAFGVNQDFCTKLFKKYLHTTPSIYFREKRIARAKQLLITTEKSVSEISLECGMDNSYLSKIFRETIGCNPLDFRRQYYREHFLE